MQHGDLVILVSEWVPPAIKRNYWDKILSGQGHESESTANTGHNHPGATAQNEGSQHDNNNNDNNNNIDNNNDGDDIDNLDNDPEPVDPLLATNFFDYD